LNDSRKEAHRKKPTGKMPTKKAHRKNDHKEKYPQEKMLTGAKMPTEKNSYIEKCAHGKVTTWKNVHSEILPTGIVV